MKYVLLFCLGLFSFSRPVQAEIQTEWVEYQDGDTVLQGYLAYDDAMTEKRPGVLVIHEWKGFGEYVQRRARMLAELGYVAFAADMYGKGIFAKDHQEAAKLSGAFFQDRAMMRARAQVALDVLKNQQQVDPDRLAAIGYCFGGASVIELARSGAPLRAVVTFHGILKTPMPARPGEVQAKIFVMHGEEDTVVKPEDLTAFQQEMENAGVDWRMLVFPGAVHSFTVPESGNDKSKGIAYNEEADQESWRAMKQFFKETL